VVTTLAGTTDPAVSVDKHCNVESVIVYVYCLDFCSVLDLSMSSITKWDTYDGQHNTEVLRELTALVVAVA
jgi:hypothetical protein